MADFEKVWFNANSLDINSEEKSMLSKPTNSNGIRHSDPQITLSDSGE